MLLVCTWRQLELNSEIDSQNEQSAKTLVNQLNGWIRFSLCVFVNQELTSLGKPKRPRSPFNIFMSEHFAEARGSTTQVGSLKPKVDLWQQLDLFRFLKTFIFLMLKSENSQICTIN